MTADVVGKREAHRTATRRAIQQSADRLFDAKGYVHTTVREIADAAGVTERTFFRYFAGKEALLVRDIETWLPVLGLRIRTRPPREAPLEAVEESLLLMARQREGILKTRFQDLFTDGPPAAALGKAAPAILLQFEQVIADALHDRLTSNDRSATDARFTSQVLARCSVAALRSAALRDWQLRQSGESEPRAIDQLIADAFRIVREHS